MATQQPDKARESADVERQKNWIKRETADLNNGRRIRKSSN